MWTPVFDSLLHPKPGVDHNLHHWTQAYEILHEVHKGAIAPTILIFETHGVLDWIANSAGGNTRQSHLLSLSGLLYDLVTTHYKRIERRSEVYELAYSTLRTSTTFKEAMRIPELSYYWLTRTAHGRKVEGENVASGDEAPVVGVMGEESCQCGDQALSFILASIRDAWADPEYSNPERWIEDEYRREVLQSETLITEWKVEEWKLEPEWWSQKRIEVENLLQQEFKALQGNGKMVSRDTPGSLDLSDKSSAAL